MNKLTFKLLVGSVVALGAAAFTLGVVNELRTIKRLTTDADPDEAADEDVTVEVLPEEAEEAPAEDAPVEAVEEAPVEAPVEAEAVEEAPVQETPAE